MAYGIAMIVCIYVATYVVKTSVDKFNNFSNILHHYAGNMFAIPNTYVYY